MKIFIIHRGLDYEKVEKLKAKITETVNVDLLALESNNDNEKWYKEAKKKINQSDMVLYALGDQTYDSDNVDLEIKYSLKKKKQILLYRLNPEQNDTISKALYKKDAYNNKEIPLYKEFVLDDLVNIFKYGYGFDIKDKLNETKDPKRENELIEQYKTYLATSEEVLTRRQNTSNFYTTLNTSMLTIASTACGLIFGISGINNSLLIVSIIMLIMGVIGILLNLNWMSLIESYGRLNGAKMTVISEIEKSLPANIYDTEWKVMSEKLGSSRYVSFTSIEKRLPLFFIIMFIVMLCLSIGLLVFSLI